jgi:alpha-L-arabinofuranosidase
VNGNSPQKPIKGVPGIDTSAKPSGSATFPLDIFAALSADKKTIAISIINPTETAQECNLNFSGTQVAGAGKLWQITAPAGVAAAAPGGRGAGGAPATMAEKAQEAPAKINVPAASISVYEFPVK